MVPLKYLSNFWRTVEMPLIDYKISPQLKWFKNCIIVAGTAANQNPYFQKTDTKLYVPVVTLSTQDNIKLLKQLESDFKRTISCNKYLSKARIQPRNRYLDFLIDGSFLGVNRLFVLSFKDEDDRQNHSQYYLPTVEIKNYKVMIDEINFFDQPTKNQLKHMKTSERLQPVKVMITQLDVYQIIPISKITIHSLQ